MIQKPAVASNAMDEKTFKNSGHIWTMQDSSDHLVRTDLLGMVETAFSAFLAKILVFSRIWVQS